MVEPDTKAGRTLVQLKTQNLKMPQNPNKIIILAANNAGVEGRNMASKLSNQLKQSSDDLKGTQMKQKGSIKPEAMTALSMKSMPKSTPYANNSFVGSSKPKFDGRKVSVASQM